MPGTSRHCASSRSKPDRITTSHGAARCARRDRRTRSPSRAHFSVFMPAKRGTLQSGAGGGSGFATSEAARSAGAQDCRAQRGLGARVGAVRRAASMGPLRRRPCDEALGAEHRSAVARRPQAVADRGRMSETGTPTRPATRGLRAPADRPTLRHPAKQPAPRRSPVALRRALHRQRRPRAHERNRNPPRASRREVSQRQPLGQRFATRRSSRRRGTPPGLFEASRPGSAGLQPVESCHGDWLQPHGRDARGEAPAARAECVR